jgi:hypothetical protein
MASTNEAKVQKAAQQEREALLQINKPIEEGEIIAAFGQRIKAKPFGQVINKYKDPGLLLAEAAKILKEPLKPGWKVGWPLKTDPRAIAFMRAGKYIKVQRDQIKDDVDLITHEGTDDSVYWYDHIMVLIPPEVVAEIYEWPQDLANSRLLRRNEDDFKDMIRTESKGKAEGFVSNSR